MTLTDYLKGKNQTAFAERVGRTQGMVWQWANGAPVSPRSVLAVCAATDWVVTPHEIRPDIYPNPTDGLPPGRAPNGASAGHAAGQGEQGMSAQYGVGAGSATRASGEEVSCQS